jgi:hypothetical protein
LGRIKVRSVANHLEDLARWTCLLSRVMSRGPSGFSIATLYEQQLEEMRRMNAALERIASVMEKRAQN